MLLLLSALLLLLAWVLPPGHSGRDRAHSCRMVWAFSLWHVANATCYNSARRFGLSAEWAVAWVWWSNKAGYIVLEILEAIRAWERGRRGIMMESGDRGRELGCRAGGSPALGTERDLLIPTGRTCPSTQEATGRAQSGSTGGAGESGDRWGRSGQGQLLWPMQLRSREGRGCHAGSSGGMGGGSGRWAWRGKPRASARDSAWQGPRPRTEKLIETRKKDLPGAERRRRRRATVNSPQFARQSQQSAGRGADSGGGGGEQDKDAPDDLAGGEQDDEPDEGDDAGSEDDAGALSGTDASAVAKAQPFLEKRQVEPLTRAARTRHASRVTGGQYRMELGIGLLLPRLSLALAFLVDIRRLLDPWLDDLWLKVRVGSLSFDVSGDTMDAGMDEGAGEGCLLDRDRDGRRERGVNGLADIYAMILVPRNAKQRGERKGSGMGSQSLPRRQETREELGKMEHEALCQGAGCYERDFPNVAYCLANSEALALVERDSAQCPSSLLKPPAGARSARRAAAYQYLGRSLRNLGLSLGIAALAQDGCFDLAVASVQDGTQDEWLNGVTIPFRVRPAAGSLTLSAIARADSVWRHYGDTSGTQAGLLRSCTRRLSSSSAARTSGLLRGRSVRISQRIAAHSALPANASVNGLLAKYFPTHLRYSPRHCATNSPCAGLRVSAGAPTPHNTSTVKRKVVETTGEAFAQS
ncbi:hypothetical protein BC834DRAFT_843879 [Gloeopeniophorella convolvens]|nr:hypothetical protein BC834DRAFT_843879 [Gloeopeniophorella convolvens]